MTVYDAFHQACLFASALHTASSRFCESAFLRVRPSVVFGLWIYSTLSTRARTPRLRPCHRAMGAYKNLKYSAQGRIRRKRDRSGNSGEGPQFKITGQHVVLFVALVFAALWFAGLLPDP